MLLDDQKYWLELVLTPGMNFKDCYALLKAFGLPESIFNQSLSSLMGVIPQSLAVAIYRHDDSEVQEKVFKVMDFLSKNPKARLIVPSDEDFPRKFYALSEPPLLTLAVGDVSLLNNETLSLEGTSHPSSDGQNITQNWTRALLNKDLTLVQSDQAGVENIALKTAAQFGSNPFIFVSNFREIDANFAQQLQFMSERGLFLGALGDTNQVWLGRRKLLIAAVEHFVVIEAGIRSRTLSLVREAADAGRNVMAVPGSIHSPLSKGCHKLIREGARLVESVDDILEEAKN